MTILKYTISFFIERYLNALTIKVANGIFNSMYECYIVLYSYRAKKV